MRFLFMSVWLNINAILFFLVIDYSSKRTLRPSNSRVGVSVQLVEFGNSQPHIRLTRPFKVKLQASGSPLSCRQDVLEGTWSASVWGETPSLGWGETGDDVVSLGNMKSQRQSSLHHMHMDGAFFLRAQSCRRVHFKESLIPKLATGVLNERFLNQLSISPELREAVCGTGQPGRPPQSGIHPHETLWSTHINQCSCILNFGDPKNYKESTFGFPTPTPETGAKQITSASPLPRAAWDPRAPPSKKDYRVVPGRALSSRAAPLKLDSPKRRGSRGLPSKPKCMCA